MGFNKIQGTPWHVEPMHREENDDKRHSHRCIYYQDEKKYCAYKYCKCTGSAHCDEYEAMSDEEFKKKQAKNNRRKTDDDTDFFAFGNDLNREMD